MMETVTVGLGQRSYPIAIGRGLLDEAGTRIAALGFRRVVAIADAAVAARHEGRLMAALEGAGLRASLLTVPSGEASKAMPVLAGLVEQILDLGIDRRTGIIAFGGGVIGDLAGFAAAVTLRGLDFVQIPTTLLAQVDSSVGGKTGVNARQGKNLIGAFHQPRLVIADLGLLDTLPPRELRAGYAEVVKYGALGDAAFFDWLEANGAALLSGDDAARRHAVARCCAMKAEIVGEDEREAGRRALLNLGHTFGHALEAETGFGAELLHGEAVAIGMVMAFETSVRLGLCPAADRDRLVAHLTATGLPVRPDPARRWDPDVLLGHMAKDKKVRDGRMVFVLVRGLGSAFVADDVPTDLVRSVLAAAL